MQENIPLEEVFDHLKCTREGLSADAVQERLAMFGYNKLEEKKVRRFFNLEIPLCFYAFSLNMLFFHPQENKILKFLGFMWNPLSWVMEAAAIMSIALANGGVRICLLAHIYS